MGTQPGCAAKRRALLDTSQHNRPLPQSRLQTNLARARSPAAAAPASLPASVESAGPRRQQQQKSTGRHGPAWGCAGPTGCEPVTAQSTSDCALRALKRCAAGSGVEGPRGQPAAARRAASRCVGGPPRCLTLVRQNAAPRSVAGLQTSVRQREAAGPPGMLTPSCRCVALDDLHNFTLQQHNP